jgi:hypothetical protein
MPDTTYIVLRQRGQADEDGDWTIVNHAIEAKSAAAAIQADLADMLPGDSSHAGRYVAIPQRSWQPLAVTTETRTVLKLEQPTAE